MLSTRCSVTQGCLQRCDAVIVHAASALQGDGMLLSKQQRIFTLHSADHMCYLCRTPHQQKIKHGDDTVPSSQPCK